ncbi:F-box domain, Leucine-rich repeat domain, L domain-like protein [Artemisia annua]|uniref:F-box domain, Leucine-rich repeat domain, L domain-like protein n=1 Tax=Artemisia annua TaxID=35608 RepID=A0A2U1QF94_ARTAN|nr:F-box domain, Leucine-rich repeat domain, L domain-like protein [Artemisia annua]
MKRREARLTPADPMSNITSTSQARPNVTPETSLHLDAQMIDEAFITAKYMQLDPLMRRRASLKMKMKDLLSVASSKKLKENTIDTTDRISMLPDFIVHHILSYLWKDTITRVRMSVLSKRWFTLTASFPILYFHLYGAWFRSMSRKYDYDYILEMFYKYVEHTVSRFCEQNISAHTLDIFAVVKNREEIEVFGHCLDLVLEKGLQVMHIHFIYNPMNLPMLRLPNTLLSASSLTSLRLHKCELPSSLMVGVVKFKSLRLLSLSELPIDEGVIEYLTKGCPLLEEMYLRHCYGFKTFCVKRHQNLLKVEIYCDRTFLLERIDVEAPHLSYFLLESNKDKAPSMFMASCKKLTTFCYSGSPLKRLDDLLSNFPLIENLCLDLSPHVSNLKLSNHSLKKIRLQSHCYLEEIDLSTPSLLLFEYYDRFFGANSGPLSRKHSSMSKGSDLYQGSTHPCRKDKKIIDIEELKLIQLPPYELEHVKLKDQNCWKTSVYVALVDAVLWCCRPRSLTLVLYHSANKGDVVEYTYEKLLQQEGKGETNIKFVMISSSKDKKQFSDLNSLLKALLLGQFGCKITFIKEEDAYSRAGVGSQGPSLRSAAHPVGPVKFEKFPQGSSKKMEETTIDTTDRISMLPEFIVHHIISYLWNDPKSRVRMSVLSKEWFALTASFPLLFFHLGARRNVCFRGLDSFYRYVEYTVSRFCEQNISAHTLDISTEFVYLEQMELVGHCLELVIEKGVEVLVIDVAYWVNNLPMFRLPNTLSSASSLTSLTLNKCELPSSLMDDDVKFESLKLLSLTKLRIDEGVIERLNKSCPVLKEIYLKSCYGFKTFCVKAHHNLLKVEIYGDITFLIESIDVEAPNLSHFVSVNYKDKTPSMFLASCKKLKTFCYSGIPLKSFSDILSNFPFIENLCLEIPLHANINNLNLSNHSLRKIRLHSQCDLEDIDLNTPSLLLFGYYDRYSSVNIAPLSRKHSSMSKGCMKCFTRDSVEILWFQKLRKFLEKNSIFKVLKLDIYSTLIDVEDLKLIQSSPYKLEHVELKHESWRYKSPAYVALVDAMLWCCCPRSLTLVLYHFIDTSHVVKYTYEKLLQQEDEGQTNIKFVLISSSKDEQHFSDLNSLLQRLYISLDQVKGKQFSDGSKSKITFIKEEGPRRLNNIPALNIDSHFSDTRLLHSDYSKQGSSKKMKKNTKHTTDRISMLPDFIVHHILSFLRKDTKSLVRMSVLSKEWFALTASFPLLYFHQRGWYNLFPSGYASKYIMEKFYKYVEYTVSRFCEQNISAHTLDISANIINLEQRELFGRCFDLVLEKGLQMMEIHFGYYPVNVPMFRFSNTLLSASSLTYLTLQRCELPSSLMVGVVKFKSLRLLSLSDLPIDEGVFEYLTKGCPLLEEIYLRYCNGFKTLCVKRHQNLLKAEIYCDRTSILERIDVEAPNLSYFLLESNKDKAPFLFMGSCKKLTTFCYSGSPLDLPPHVNNLKLSNHSLRKIRLQSHCDLEKIDLNKPSLLLFEYYDQCYRDDANIEPLTRKHSSMSKSVNIQTALNF